MKSITMHSKGDNFFIYVNHTLGIRYAIQIDNKFAYDFSENFIFKNKLSRENKEGKGMHKNRYREVHYQCCVTKLPNSFTRE